MTDSKCLYCGSGNMIYACPLYCGKCGKKVEGSDVLERVSPEREAQLREMLKLPPPPKP